MTIYTRKTLKYMGIKQTNTNAVSLTLGKINDAQEGISAANQIIIKAINGLELAEDSKTKEVIAMLKEAHKDGRTLFYILGEAYNKLKG
jgi:hypothetical protein